MTTTGTLSFAFVKVSEVKYLHFGSPICGRLQRKLRQCPFSHQPAAYMRLICFPLSLKYWDLLKSYTFCIHFVEIELLPDVSKVLSIVLFEPDFYFMLQLNIFTATAESRCDHFNTGVAVWYISIKIFFFSRAVALELYNYKPYCSHTRLNELDDVSRACYSINLQPYFLNWPDGMNFIHFYLLTLGKTSLHVFSYKCALNLRLFTFTKYCNLNTFSFECFCV